MITLTQFKELYPRCKEPEKWVIAFKEVLPAFKINNEQRLAAFISQCGHESAGFSTFEENLNYSAKALKSVFGKYFTDKDANEYARKPEKIANLVYGNRMGNGNEQSGDGWKYRGRGPIQLTGKDNYKSFTNAFNVNAVEDPDLVSKDEKISLLSAVWFWESRNLSVYADKNDIIKITKRINGGYHGLKERINEYISILLIMGIPVLLKNGSKGNMVKNIQTLFGITADGEFGNNTEKVIKNWQSSKGLIADGILGPKSLKVLVS